MRDTNAYLQTGVTSSAAISSTAFAVGNPGTPFEGIPIAVRLDNAVCPTSGPITFTVSIQESDSPTSGWATIVTFPALSVSSTATSSQITKRVATRKQYIRAATTYSATSGTNVSVPYNISVVAADVT